MELVWWMRKGIPPARCVDDLPIKFYNLAQEIDTLFDTVKYETAGIDVVNPGDVIIPLNNR